MKTRSFLSGLGALLLLVTDATADAQSIPFDETVLSETFPRDRETGRGVPYWDTTCRQDSFTDSAICVVSRGMGDLTQGDLVLVFSADRRPALFIGGINHQPGTAVAIRVDELPSLSWPAAETPASPQAEALLEQLQSGAVARTRWFSFPDRRQRDQQVSLAGLGDAIARARAVVGGLHEYDPDQAARAAEMFAGKVAGHARNATLCDPDAVGETDAAIASGLQQNPDILRAFRQAEKKFRSTLAAFAPRADGRKPDCAVEVADLRRQVRRFLAEAARFR